MRQFSHKLANQSHKSPNNQLLKSVILLIGLASTKRLATASSSTTQIYQSNLTNQSAKEWAPNRQNDNDAQHAITRGQLRYYTSLECTRDCAKLDDDTFRGEHNLAGLSFAVLHSRLHTCEYNFLHMHHYESHSELQLAAGPQVDQELCLRQLDELNGRANKSQFNLLTSDDIELGRLLDTFGRIESGLMNGNSFWTGSYGECLRLRTHSDTVVEEGGRMSHRYCVARLRHKQWPDVQREILSLRLGVCLPSACDSSNFKNKLKLVENLIQINDKLIDFEHTFDLDGLYCLPDEQSPLRSIWHTPRSAIAISFFILWLSIVTVATVWHIRLLVFGRATSGDDQLPHLLRSLSIINNLNKLLIVAPKRQAARKPNPAVENHCERVNEESDDQKTTDKNTTALQVNRTIAAEDVSNAALANGAQQSTKPTTTTTTTTTTATTTTSTTDASDEKKVVDLSCVEGIKVISMCYVICGHVLMCSTVGVQNHLRVHAANGAFYMSNMVPAFAVNSFFVITGLLTSYLIFKQNQKTKLILNPIKWVAVIAYRYLRIMPMYMLVVLYSKELAKFSNKGPIWDYATSGSSHRRVCEQESWLWTLLFAANFKKPLDHCIPGGWYLANDFQFSLVTPIFLVLLYKSPQIGKLILRLCILTSFSACFLSIYLNKLDDFRPIANFDPHGFKTYITYLSHNYTRPYYRIPAYLCGLYMGFLLYEYEQNKINHLKTSQRKNLKPNAVDANDKVHSKHLDEPTSRHQLDESPEWSKCFLTLCKPVCSNLLFICCVTPFVSSFIPFNKFWAKLMTSSVQPLYHLFVAIGVGWYILLAATRPDQTKILSKILSASQWKPVSRLSLSAMLINVEVMSYLFHGRQHLYDWNAYYLMSVNLHTIVVVHLCSMVVFVLFESPMTALLNQLLAYVSRKFPRNQRTKTKLS